MLKELINRLCFIILIVLFPSVLFSGSLDVTFDHVFTSNYSIGITQDRDGFIWIGTANGVVKYDGYDQVVYRSGKHGLSSNIAPVVFADSKGLIWIGTAGGGLNVYDKNTNSFRVYSSKPENAESISSDSFLWAVDQIAEDHSGDIWAGTAHGLNRFNRDTGTFTRFFNDPVNPNSISDNTIWSICTDRDGLIWIGTQNGLNCYNRDTDQFIRYMHDPDNPDSLSDNWVYAVTESRDGMLWIGTKNGGMNRFDKKTQTFTHYRSNPSDSDSLSHDEVFFIREDRFGDLWIGRSYSNPMGLGRCGR